MRTNLSIVFIPCALGGAIMLACSLMLLGNLWPAPRRVRLACYKYGQRVYRETIGNVLN
jgi:hypothetical protein